MKILVIGCGGREHALVWKLAQSPRAEKIFCAPGNAGIAEIAECVSIKSDDITALTDFAKKQKIDLTVVGPEIALMAGIVDAFERNGLKIFGPSKRAAQLEGSKAYAKQFMQKYGIPTANYGVFTDVGEARSFIKSHGLPIVIKADGLCAGKGVVICKNEHDANSAVDAMLKKGEFGEAGSRIVIEEFLEGEEASFICISDGKHVLPFASSQDHKAVYDGDAGPNTGGMGAYSPARVVTPAMQEKVMNEMIRPAVSFLAAEGRPYVGFLYAGLMISSGVPRVLEFNVRMGDPETQPLMLRLRSDLVELIELALDGRLNEADIRWDDAASVCVVMASRGYPGHYEKGLKIEGLTEASCVPGAVVFHAGTAMKDDNIITDGGRVLGVTALGNTHREAIGRAYEAAYKITWGGVHYRKDIGWRELKKCVSA
ncbi:MAG: phosphoribosylamine--glycine ligase [Deltaproteobacteria bacterium RIFCSPLOWO2_02_FULL_47_10]|nr:MAG: phosphoribosylamine--glycine ligase [Deltaproteobacteria bacterium RIFCSPLOWO2_02_FULL_47_10]